MFVPADKKIVSIGPNTTLRAKAVGTTTIKVSCGELSYEVTVNVIE